MGDVSTYRQKVDPTSVLGIGTGGTGRERAEYKDGVKTGQSLTRNGGAVHRLTGFAVSVDGVGLDGATVETSTPLGEVSAGTIFKAEGEVELTIRSVARAGFGAVATPRGVLEFAIYIERLTPAGNAADLVRSASRKAASESRAN